MNQSLTRVLMTRAAAAEKRLTALTQQQERGEKQTPQVCKSAIRELGDALEEVRVATEHLQIAADDLAVTRREATENADRYRELYEALPMPCIITNDQGTVDEANTLASKLLNVAAPYLGGKPLLLYLPQRDVYFKLMQDVSASGSASARAMLRPRDRKPVDVHVSVTALRRQMRWCWVFHAAEAQASKTPVVSREADGLLAGDPAAS